MEKDIYKFRNIYRENTSADAHLTAPPSAAHPACSAGTPLEAGNFEPFELGLFFSSLFNFVLELVFHSPLLAGWQLRSN